MKLALKREFVLFLLLKCSLHKVTTDFSMPLMPKDQEQTKETKGEQTASNKGKQKENYHQI